MMAAATTSRVTHLLSAGTTSGAEVYALHPHLLDPANLNLIDAPHLLSTLAPDTRATVPTH